jgi:hypothetical protein
MIIYFTYTLIIGSDTSYVMRYIYVSSYECVLNIYMSIATL